MILINRLAGSFLALALLVLAACSPSTGVGLPDNSREDTATATPQATRAPRIDNGVVVEAADGLRLAGTFYTPADTPPPWPGVILLHMIYGDQKEWGDFPQKLSDEGYAVFAIDLRGHGKTGGEMDWDQSRDDLQRVWRYMTGRGEVDPNRIAIIGASMGANMALVASAAQPEVGALGLLSPGLDYYRVTTADALAAYGQRPLLIVASDEDSYSAESSRQLSELAGDSAELVMYSQAGHGSAMLQSKPELADTLIDWLNRTLIP
jgi:dienelactone hydrolase